MQLIAKLDKLPIYAEPFRFTLYREDDELEYEPYKIYEILVKSIPFLIIIKDKARYVYVPTLSRRYNNDLLWSLNFIGDKYEDIENSITLAVLPDISIITEHIRETSALKEKIQQLI